jgi:hypothetical protein
MFMGRNVHGAKCPWGEMSMGRNDHGANFPQGKMPWGGGCPWGELSMERAAMVRVVQSPYIRRLDEDKITVYSNKYDRLMLKLLIM